MAKAPPPEPIDHHYDIKRLTKVFAITSILVLPVFGVDDVAGLRARLEELAEEVRRERPQEDARGAPGGLREDRSRRRGEVPRAEARGRARAAPQSHGGLGGRGPDEEGRRAPGTSPTRTSASRRPRWTRRATTTRRGARTSPKAASTESARKEYERLQAAYAESTVAEQAAQEGVGRGEGGAGGAREDEEGRRGGAREARRRLRPVPEEARDAPAERRLLLRAQRAHRGHARPVPQDPAGPARRPLQRRELPQEPARRPLHDLPHRGRDPGLRGQGEVPPVRPEDASPPRPLRRLELAASVRDVRLHVVPRRARPRDGLHARRPHAERLRAVRAARRAARGGARRQGPSDGRRRREGGDGRDADGPLDEGVRLGGRQVQRPAHVPDEGRGGRLLPLPPERRGAPEGAEARPGPKARRAARLLELPQDEGPRGPAARRAESLPGRVQDDARVGGALAREPARLPEQHEDAALFLPRELRRANRGTGSRTR